MPGNLIQWFPGHMALTRRLIKEHLPEVDIVFELLDARIPSSSRNPEIQNLLNGKPSLILLNKADLADPQQNAAFVRALSTDKTKAILVDCKKGKGLEEIRAAASNTLKEKWDRYREKGISKPIRAMVVGIPNVGKSTLINQLAGSKKAQTENRPGVTKTKQWVKAGKDLELLDMPGVLWPKFDDQKTAENLAMTGAIKDSILQSEEIAVLLCGRIAALYPEFLTARYHLAPEDLEKEPYELFLKIGKKRGLLQSRGEVNEPRCAAMLLGEFRSGAIGRITLDTD